MPSYYIYLVSSLPMLHFGARPPVSSEEFLQMCRGVVSDGDFEVIRRILQTGEYDEKIQPSCEAERKWRAFDVALRNEFVRIRAARKRMDPLKYIRRDGYTDPSIAHVALRAHRTPELLEAEKMLDEKRWYVLDELSIGHYFDIDLLVIYTYKLLILQRWERINAADPSEMIENVLK